MACGRTAVRSVLHLHRNETHCTESTVAMQSCAANKWNFANFVGSRHPDCTRHKPVAAHRLWWNENRKLKRLTSDSNRIQLCMRIKKLGNYHRNPYSRSTFRADDARIRSIAAVRQWKLFLLYSSRYLSAIRCAQRVCLFNPIPRG